MRLAAFSILICLVAPVGACLAVTADKSATASMADVDSLISKLGDPDFHVRRDASRRLREIGPAALPALRQAADNPNPEIQARAGQIVRSLEYRHVPGRPLHHPHHSSMSLSVTNGQRVLDIDDEGRQIHLVQGQGGIRMTVSGETNGKAVTETYRAATADQLRADNPEAFALFQRCMLLGSDEFDNIAPNQQMVQRNFVLPPQPLPILRADPDDVEGLRDRIEGQMAKAHVSDARKRQIEDALDRVDAARVNDTPEDPDKGIHEYNQACDDLRKQLKDAKLPDPGDALPPPQNARLGISSPGADPAGGIVVSHVVPDSRAERIGLQKDDIIHKVNGKDVATVQELRKIVTEHPKGLVMDITRDARDMQLKEK